MQIAEVTPNTKRGARGLILPAASLPGNPARNLLLPQTAAELQRLGISPREVALDGGFNAGGAGAEGLTNLDICDRLYLSMGTVKTHMAAVFAKPGIAGRGELIRELRVPARCSTVRGASRRFFAGLRL